MAAAQKSRNCDIRSIKWCFTDFDCLDWEGLFNSNTEKIRALGFGREVCPTTGRAHYQGWIQMLTRMRMPGMKKLIGSKNIHIEPMQGKVCQSIKYCSKDGDYQQFGEPVERGARTDLKVIVDKIQSGERLNKIALEEPEVYCRYRNGIIDIARIQLEEETREFRFLDVSVYSGPTGTGKTKKATEECEYVISGSDIGKWWDGYTGQSSVCIDEYNNNVPIDKLLRILDGHQLRLEIKGGHTYASYTKVIITTNLEKDEFHGSAKDAHRDALFRRINRWVEFS